MYQIMDFVQQKKTKFTYMLLSYTDNTVPTNALAPKVSRASAGMVFTPKEIPQNFRNNWQQWVWTSFFKWLPETNNLLLPR